MKRNNFFSNDDLKEIFNLIEEVVITSDKIMSGFDDHKKMSLAMLLFFSESNLLDRLSKVRSIVNTELELRLSKDEYDEFIENDIDYWKPPYNKTEADLLEMQDENLIWKKYQQ